MLLTNYDFYDVYAYIVNFRSFPEKFKNYLIPTEQIISYMNAPIKKELDNNTIRKIIRPFYNNGDSMLWVTVDNIYTANLCIIKHISYYSMLSAIFEEMLRVYENEQQFVQLCDAVHNIPLILANEKKPEKVIKIMIKEYREKYNRDFLVDELKKLKVSNRVNR